MITLLKELKALMKARGLSPGDVSRLIGISEKTAYNWLVYESSSPGLVYQEKIRRVIQKIEKESLKDSINLTINKYFQALWSKLTLKEKEDLLEIIGRPGEDSRDEYLEKLKELAESYGIQIHNEEKS